MSQQTPWYRDLDMYAAIAEVIRPKIQPNGSFYAPMQQFCGSNTPFVYDQGRYGASGNEVTASRMYAALNDPTLLRLVSEHLGWELAISEDGHLFVTGPLQPPTRWW